MEDQADPKNTVPIKTSKKVIDLTKLNQPPQPINMFLSNVRGAILTGKAKKVHSNLPRDERNALNHLIALQKNGSIVVTRCDKTGSLAILDRSQYTTSMNEILSTKIRDNEGISRDCYAKSDMKEVMKDYESIGKLIKKRAWYGII